MYGKKQKTVRRFFRVEFGGPEFKGVVLLGALTIVLGTFFYSHIEGWSTLDALYFSISTLTTVGTGDVAPVTEAGRAFTAGYMLVGVGIVFGFISMVAQRTHHISLNADVDLGSTAHCDKCGK